MSVISTQWWWGIVAIGLLVIVVGWQYENWRGQRDWAEVRAGFVTDESQLDWRTYWPEPVADDLNAARHAVFSSVRVPNAEDEVGLYRLDFETLRSELEALTGDSPGTKGLEEDFIDQFVDAAERPHWQWVTVDEVKTSNWMPPVGHITGMREYFDELVALVHSRATAHLDSGNPDRAGLELTALHAFATSMDSDPMFHASLTNVWMAGSAAKDLTNLLNHSGWSASSLELLQSSLEIDLLDTYYRAISLDRVTAVNFGESLIRGEAEVSFSPAQNDLDRIDGWVSLIHRGMPSGWKYQNLVYRNKNLNARYFDHYDREKRVFDVAGRQFARFSNVPPLPLNIFPYWAFISSGIEPSLTKAQSQWELHALVCALKRYWLKKGECPDMLEELIPDFIDRVPHDFATGKPVTYIKKEGHIRLLGLDWNRTGVASQNESVVTLPIENRINAIGGP